MKVIWRFVRSKGLRACTSLHSRKSFTGIAALLALLTCPVAGSAKTQSFTIVDSYWTNLHERLARLANRIDAAAQAKILAAPRCSRQPGSHRPRPRPRSLLVRTAWPDYRCLTAAPVILMKFAISGSFF